MKTNSQVKYVLHYKETPDGIQWDKEFPTKPEADAEAYKIFLNGGISIVVEVIKDEEDDIVMGKIIDDTEGD